MNVDIIDTSNCQGKNVAIKVCHTIVVFTHFPLQDSLGLFRFPYFSRDFQIFSAIEDTKRKQNLLSFTFVTICAGLVQYFGQNACTKQS